MILTPEKANECLREAKILANLNHENIISYKAAWVEQLPIPFILREVSSTDVSFRKDFCCMILQNL